MALNRSAEIEGGEKAANGQSSLFEGMSFWLSQNVPQRSRFKELVQQNGGVVRLQEKDADVLIVDHTRKNLPPNVYSYQFIEKSIQNGVLQDLEKYIAGPSSARPVGATNIPTRGHRLAYTLEDDQILWDYMQPFEIDPTAPIRGNKLYQDFAAKYPRHTYQSWRDRYLKRLQGRPRPGGMVEPTVTRAANRETRTEARSSTRPGETVNRRSETPQEPQETKRKRSPEPTTASHRTFNGTNNAQQRQEEILQIQIPSEPLVRRDSSRHETPSTPKKVKATAQSDTENAIISEPTQTDSNVIYDLFHELPFFGSEPEPDEEGEEPEQDIDTWIEDRLHHGKGDEAQILEALQCTSMDPDLADTVLESLVAGKGIPPDTRGVWTAQDDSCVHAQDSREIQRVLDKHGWDLFKAREDYLGLAGADVVERQVD
ncbi:TRF2-interacting telomeric protein/Rap1 C terminal domain-containing protein [Aspergillus pseudoustus]|uniref:DNA-binding protein RAP1 n=1 Tax=Aspergillus pseudoustus TaxID=1810923 RepID=A0ABR4L0C1_9EURO